MFWAMISPMRSLSIDTISVFDILISIPPLSLAAQIVMKSGVRSAPLVYNAS
jgi:hypothetical protein